MKFLQQNARKFGTITTTVALAFAFPCAAHAMLDNARQTLATYTLDAPHWYASANIGVSHLFDKPGPASANSVDENGPGFNVNAGYQFNSMFGAEGGFNKYHNSRQTTATTNVAQTEHYSVYLAGTGKYPLANKFSALGKLGAAYNYANKIFNAGAAAAAENVSLYYGIGVTYSLTQKIDFVGQWSRSLGNHLTGSADLYSLGITTALV
ncbi:MAG TPA: outer membrane beta-barrel protein [Gammaproteobacteria bacterium]|jgi:opacity protein-like surface antigen|nr:outer membrane beta-barrel protein [Gammaproteobacteria bacterium]